mgnify:FL=1
MSVVDELAALMADKGQRNYGENVTIAEHVLLTAGAAQAQGASDTLIAACLLHDVGHWLDEPDDDFGIHAHGDTGGAWVAERFEPAVAEPVRLHVEAKRYLCAVDPEYHDRLSPASQYTLTQQNGPMGIDEVAAFEANKYFQDAVALRVFEDDHGKKTGTPVPLLKDFAALLLQLANDDC